MARVLMVGRATLETPARRVGVASTTATTVVARRTARKGGGTMDTGVTRAVTSVGVMVVTWCTATGRTIPARLAVVEERNSPAFLCASSSCTFSLVETRRMHDTCSE